MWTVASLIFVNLKKTMVQYKTASQYFVCYKNQANPSKNQVGFNVSQFLQGTKIESIFAKELQKPNRFLCLLQKPS